MHNFPDWALEATVCHFSQLFLRNKRVEAFLNNYILFFFKISVINNLLWLYFFLDFFIIIFYYFGAFHYRWPAMTSWLGCMMTGASLSCEACNRRHMVLLNVHLFPLQCCLKQPSSGGDTCTFLFWQSVSWLSNSSKLLQPPLIPGLLLKRLQLVSVVTQPSYYRCC